MIIKIQEIDGVKKLVLTKEVMENFNLKEDDVFEIHYENGNLILTVKELCHTTKQ